jgi:hypothetical protein
LTPIWTYAPLFIKEKLKNGRLVIGGGAAGMDFSLGVYAERNDLNLQEFPDASQIEVLKGAREQGKYMHPDLYDQDSEKGIIQPIIR